MRVPRFFGEYLPQNPGDLYTLPADEAAHASRVLRLVSGDPIHVFDGRGGAGRFTLESVTKKQVTAVLEQRLEDERNLPFQVTIAAPPPKGKRVRRFVESLTELGVTALVPLQLTRSQNKLPSPAEVRRWAIEAAKQCGRNALPQTRPEVDLDGLLKLREAHDLALLPDTVDAAPLRDALGGDAPRSVLVALGPEGGFVDTEREALKLGGFTPVRLGRSVLRIETAAAGIVAALVARWG